MTGRSGKITRDRRLRVVSQKRKAEADPEFEVKTEQEEESDGISDFGERGETASIKTELVTRWEWQGDENMWTAFSPLLNSQINLAFSSGKRCVTVSPVVGVSLQVDMKRMVQKNKQSGYQRPVRLAVKDEDQFFVWQWQTDDGSWISYDSNTCISLETALQTDAKLVSLSLGDRAYTIDLADMVQKNNQTHNERQIQRCLSAAADSGGNLQKQNISNGPKGVKRARGSRNSGNVENESEENKEQVRTLVLKGKAPVDPECSSKLGKAHVFCEGDDVYDVMLNQTNLQFNNNKYYLIQLLEDDSARSFSVWMRWGRVGKVGQNSLVSCGGDLQKAKDVFQKKMACTRGCLLARSRLLDVQIFEHEVAHACLIFRFFDKTKNLWSERGNFEKVAGKYDMLQLDYNSTTKIKDDHPQAIYYCGLQLPASFASHQEEEEKVVKEEIPADVPKPECKLDTSVQDLIQLICNLQSMEETVLEMKYDTKKAPLGKLTVEQIRAGYCSLQRIETCIKKQKFGRDLLEACNEFYTRVPHDFGLRTPPLIKTLEELALKIRLLEALGDIQIAVKLASMELGSLEHPVDRQYRQLHCSIQPLDNKSSEFQLIERYLQSTHAPTHNDYTMTLLQVFQLQREGEESNFRADLPNRMLLWHGSRLSNWVGILSQGLRVAPREAPATGYMFGKGIYFADISSKSANYCFSSRDKNVGILLLSEVALGECLELLEADYDAQKKLKGKNSTKGLGRSSPNPKNSITHDGAMVPLGPLIDTGVINDSGYTLNYNEYIVYDSCQVRMKYLLQVRFNYTSLW